MKKDTEQVNVTRHEHGGCKVCAHPQREDIERDFINWKSAATITKEYGLTNRASVYRHAHALGLFDKRRRNVRRALEAIIERSGEVTPNAQAVVQAVIAYSKINSQGVLIERTEKVDLTELWNKMSAVELENYAKTGELPRWFTETVGVGRED